MNALEHAAREAWIRWGGYAQFNTCARCGGWHYCRSRGGQRYLCLTCYDETHQ